MNEKQSRLISALSPIPVIGERNAYQFVLEHIKKEYNALYLNKPEHEAPWTVSINQSAMKMTFYLRMAVYLSSIGIGSGLYELASLVSRIALNQ